MASLEFLKLTKSFKNNEHLLSFLYILLTFLPNIFIELTFTCVHFLKNLTEFSYSQHPHKQLIS